jgi:predicted permease
MRWIHKLWMWRRMLFLRGRAGEQLRDELQFHLEQQMAENIAAGMSAEEARRAALRLFGNPTVLRDQARASWSWGWVESLLRDLRYGVRTLARTPGFTILAIAVMGLGIGANVALFTVVRAVLLKPLPFKDPEQLLRVSERPADDASNHEDDAGGMYAEWKKLSTSFSDMAICGYSGYNLSGTAGQLPENVQAGVFSSNLLPMLGIEPALGRGFLASDDRPSANATVILSWGLWKWRYGGDPSILNKTILLDSHPYTVIGVMHAWFLSYPQPAAKLWTPIYHEEPESLMGTLEDHEFAVVGRLKQGVSAEQAATELSLITRRLHDQHRDMPFVSVGARVRPLLDAMVGNLRTPLYVLLAATGCVLLITCLNVANLLVARTASRRKELAIRASLGGSRWSLLRGHLAESLLLSFAGGVLGLFVAYGVVQWIVSERKDMVRVGAIHVDGAAALIAVFLIALCAAFAALISSPSARPHQILASLQESSRSHSGGQTRSRLRRLLLSLEVGLTVVLLIGAGLLLKSYEKLRATDLGCITHNVLTMSVDLSNARYDQPIQRSRFLAELLSRVRNLPGIDAAGMVFPVVPGAGYGGDNAFAISEHPKLPPGETNVAYHRWADPGYFAALGVPILRGRTFGDDQRPGHGTEVIVTDSFARRFFPGEDPIGKHLSAWDAPYQIVGIVGDTVSEVGEPGRPMMYFPILAPNDWVSGAALVVRSGGDITQFALPIQKIVQQLDPDLPVSEILTMDQIIGQATLDASFDATVVLAFAVLSLLLAGVGLFGVLSYLVAQRTTEIGIRIALGAQREQVMRLMLNDGLRPAVFGLAVGLAASAGLTQLIRSMLYSTAALDPVVFALVSVVLLAVAAVACAVPAWRASRLDPILALRME